MTRTLRFFLGFCVVFLCCRSVWAQQDLNDLRMWVRFEITPGVNLSGPYRGTTRFQIGRGNQRVMMHPRIELQIVHGTKIEQHVDLPKLPVYFDWDTSHLANDRYTLRLVAVDERTQTETAMDEIRGKVDNPDASSTLSSDTASGNGVARTSVPADPPTPKFASHSTITALSGTLTVPIIDWPEGTPVHYVPVVDIYRDGIRVDSQGAGGKAPFTLHWDTAPLPNATYTLKLTVLNLVDNTETTTDEMTVTVQNEKPPLEPVVPKPETPVRRATLSSRNSFGIPRGTRTEQFKWVLLASKASGDPFPEVAAAQWALESAWGKSTSGANNYFGIKAVGDQPGTERETSEWGYDGIYTTTARFADYDSPTDGIAARLKFLKRARYSGYWTASNADAAARALQRGGYATDPNYAAQLISIMRRMGY
jgi:hypothetical protein